MDKWILRLFFFVINTNIKVSCVSENVLFKGPEGALGVDDISSFTCTTTIDAALVSWLRTTSTQYEVTVLSQLVHVNGSCIHNAPGYMECSCNTTVHQCAIKQVNITNSGDQWRCSAVMSGIVYNSYAYTVSVTYKTNESTTKRLSSEPTKTPLLLTAAGGLLAGALALACIQKEIRCRQDRFWINTKMIELCKRNSDTETHTNDGDQHSRRDESITIEDFEIELDSEDKRKRNRRFSNKSNPNIRRRLYNYRRRKI